MSYKFKRYLKSPSTLIAFCMGAIMYLSYAAAHSSWSNFALVGTALFVGVCLPTYSRMSNRSEEWINLKTALVTLGRVGRFIPQFLFNFAVFWVFVQGRVITDGALDGIGGIGGVALLTTLASQGAQYAALIFYNRGFGNQNMNVLLALSTNVMITALATTGLPLVKPLFVTGSLFFGGIVFGIGVLSDIRGRWFPRRGIGVFFGTFNPFHVTHIEIIRQALRERNLAKILVHPTIVPKLHAQALEKNQIELKGNEGGLDVLQKTKEADANVNYFPTGNRFYPPETRRLLIELALEEAGLKDKVNVLWLPEIYQEHGFHGVVSEVRRLYPGVSIHGLHGSDLGGMWVRSIYDECGWIYPLPIRRQNKVSATAIRKGEKGMTTNAVDKILTHLRSGETDFHVAGRNYRNCNGILKHIDAEGVRI